MELHIIRQLIIWSMLSACIDIIVAIPIVDYATTVKSGTLGSNKGSTEGGSLLWIKGEGFSQNGYNIYPSTTDTNMIKLIKDRAVYNCKIQYEEVTDTRLACYTPAMPKGEYLIRIHIHGDWLSISYDLSLPNEKFVSSSDSTPLINAISPNSGLPQRLVSLNGDFKTNCYSRNIKMCSDDSAPFISRIYIGGQLCNLINPLDSTTYAEVTYNSLRCHFESNEVGIFNITMIVTNGYGRSLTSSNLYRLSATGFLYNFQSYALISNVTPTSGSVQGGTILTINGQYFGESSQYPLIVNIGGEPCTILSSNLTTIQCKTSPLYDVNQTYYHGGRGLHVFYENVYIDLNNLRNSSLPMPSVNANRTWSEEASFVLQNNLDTTVWLIGYLRPPMNATFTFTLETNINSILFLSTDENPNHKFQIANRSSPQSNPIKLQNSTNYYMLCIGSTQRENIQLSVKAKMHEAISTIRGDTGTAEIQRIIIGNDITSEHQRINYSAYAPISGKSEIQQFPTFNHLFQLGFKGVFTTFLRGGTQPAGIQMALNDLPTLYPLKVTVTLNVTSFQIVFPVEMGDVPLLTIISPKFTTPRNATEIVKGIASGSKLALELDGMATNFLDLWNSDVSADVLKTEFNKLFTIQCPPSLYDSIIDSSISIANDFEPNSSNDETEFILENAFCGRSALAGNGNLYNLITDNDKIASFLCFAYKLPYNAHITISFEWEGEEEIYPLTTTSKALSLIVDTRWHYTCIDFYDIILSTNDGYPEWFKVRKVYINLLPVGAMLDTMTLRTSLPFGYEAEYIISSTDKSSSSSPCTFPFIYDEKLFYKCTINENNLPICASDSNQIYYCGSSSIEGVRRLYPKRKLLRNTLNIEYRKTDRIINISFRYDACKSPTLIKPLPPTHAEVISITNASKPIGGYFDIMFKEDIYRSIPVNITALQLTNLLQTSSSFDYVKVDRTAECGQLSYKIEWLSKGKQPLISIINSSGLTPLRSSINVVSIQQGSDGNIFYQVPNDMIRTYHIKPQVEVLVGGYPSYCSNVDNNCEFQFLIEKTPIVKSIIQNETLLKIHGNEFSLLNYSNTVLIGENGSCDVIYFNMTLIICIIKNSPSGRQTVRVNVDGKGYALSNNSLTVNVPLKMTMFQPSEGRAGGGYVLTIEGSGFSSNIRVLIGGNPCTDVQTNNFTSITCKVPMSNVLSTSQVAVSVIDGINMINATSLFTYNATDVPTISSIEPAVFNVTGGLLNITGVGFTNDSIFVFVGTQNVRIVSSLSDQIVVNLTELSPGVYPVSVQTSKGFARPLFYIEYRFYIQGIYPQVGSLYGGTDVYIQGAGFNNLTQIQFRNKDNFLFPCQIMRILYDQIHCRTTSFVRKVNITADGIHPNYGIGYAWSSRRQTVQQGTIVTWQWQSSLLVSALTYKIEQVADAYSTVALPNGFNSGFATVSGSFPYQFNTLGIYHYWSPNIDSSKEISIRGIIEVVPSESEILIVEANSSNFTAQTCTFPFTFNFVNYTECISVNDTKLWCSPTPIYSGQRLYCTPRITMPASSCYSTILNTTSCNQTNSISTSPTQFLVTSCMIESIISLSPTRGSIGTLLTLTGSGFYGNSCDYDIQIGSSYHCPIINKTTTQLICRITNNSMLDPRISHIINVIRYFHGSMKNMGEIVFKFQPSISNIFPKIGSIYGGTRVTIQGDGFMANHTLVVIANRSYTSFEIIDNTRIVLITYSEETYPNFNLTISVIVGADQALCLTLSCSFCWSTSVTPYLDSVTPQFIQGSTEIQLIGRNLLGGGGTYIDAHVSIDGNLCNVTGMNNSSMNCSVDDVEAGYHRIFGSIEGVGNIRSLLNITSEANISSISPVISSIYGGTVLNITGNGLPRNMSTMEIRVGLNLCPVIRTTGVEIQCIIPPQDNSSTIAFITIIANTKTLLTSVSLNYSIQITPNITSVNVTSRNSSIILNISGYNFIVGRSSVRVGKFSCMIYNISSTSIICSISPYQSAGQHPVVVHVDRIGNSNSDLIYTHILKITKISPMEGGYGGGLQVTVEGDGFNSTNINVNICNQTCLSVVIISNTQLSCVTPSVSIDEVNKSCNMTVAVGDVSEHIIFSYKMNLTAKVTSIIPYRGGTGGGTIVTISGTDFANSTDAVKVKIGNATCSVKKVNMTSIICETGSYFQTNLQALVTVWIASRGYATSSIYFQYVNLWSSRWTWGGNQPPELGTIVSIENEAIVYLDISTPMLKALVIENATLIFDDLKDIYLNVEYIVIVNGGRLQIGTELNPFQHRAIITIYGHLRSIELPIFGAKVLGIRSGTLEMHGKPTIKTWTHLGVTVINGSSTIVLLEPVDWPINSDIIIATTGDRFSQTESELRRIINISSDGLTITLDKPLNYTHLGLSQNLNGTIIEVRGEVGLLSRNIIFQGSINVNGTQIMKACPVGFNPEEFTVQDCYMGRYGEEVGSDQFGATIMASKGVNNNQDNQRAIIRMSNVELYNVGQAFHTGRNPIKFHMNGNMNDSYIKSCSIHYSFNRGIVIQSSNYITIENNVLFNIRGSAVFLESATEIGNIFRGNLIAFVQSSSNLLNEDYTPAAFWLTNPNNTLENNSVAGCTHYGYWYRLLPHVVMSDNKINPDFYPSLQPFGRFHNNSVHSTRRYGVWIYPEYQPTTSGFYGDQMPVVAIFERLVSWKNEKGIECLLGRTIQIKSSIIFDNANIGIAYGSAINHGNLNPTNLRSTFYNPIAGTSVIDSIIIGDANLLGQKIIPTSGGLIVMGDRGFLVQNVTFINFLNNETSALISPTKSDQCNSYCRGWLVKFSNVNFINVARRGKFIFQHDSLYEDDDGTMSGKNNSVIIMPPDGLANGSPSCTQSTYFENAIECSLSNGSWVRVIITELTNGFPNINNGDLRITDERNHTAIVQWFDQNPTGLNGYMFTIQVNQTYRVSYSTAQSWATVRYRIFVYDMTPGDYLIIQHQMHAKPNGALIKESLTPLSSLNNSHGDWYYDHGTQLFFYMIKNPPAPVIITDMGTIFDMFFCTCAGCVCPTKPTQTTQTTLPGQTVPTLPPTCATPYERYWSNDAHWLEPQSYPNWNRTKPSDYQNIVISSCIKLIIDCPLPRIRSLTINGVLEFQQGRNHTMYVDVIIIKDGGLLVAGSSNIPFSGTIDIILTNNCPYNMNSQSCVYSVPPRTMFVTGTLELHGLPHKIIWTRIASTVISGQNLIILDNSVDWSIGDEIVITTTDINISHTERHRIANIENGTIIHTLAPLTYTHLAIRHKFPNTQIVTISAAVGLLTRNIRIIGHKEGPHIPGLRIIITKLTYYSSNGYVNLSNTQFIGFGKFDDSFSTDEWAGIYLKNLDLYQSTKLVNIDRCSFDGGYNAAITVEKKTTGISITNNVIYNTYRSGIVIKGKNSKVINNLITTVYWLGTAQTSWVAEFNMNFDAAITSRSTVSVTMQSNLVAGVERTAYRIQGNACPETPAKNGIFNDYSNNEVHSAMSGVNLWPRDTGYQYDLRCVVIKGFKVYKAWYYGFYINTPRNITIDSCQSIDNQVGIFTFVVGRPAITHLVIPSRITIKNSIVIGSLPPYDCDDKIDLNSSNIKSSRMAMPIISENVTYDSLGGRSGIVFPTFSERNGMPFKSWTGISNYPSLDGSMSITNSLFAFFNDICGRHDTAIQVSQTNDDGQYPIIMKLINSYNISETNIIANGRPNLFVVNPFDCGDMDCDGLKKALIVDIDGTIFTQPSSVFSESESVWNKSGHGVNDTRIPQVIFTELNGQMKNISAKYPGRGISRSSACNLQTSWGMYKCSGTTDYRMLIIESMDSDTESRRISPVAIVSDTGYIDLINGPQDHSSCDGFLECHQRISTFMAIIQSRQSYQIYFSFEPPIHLRFRLINSDSSIKCILAVYYNSLQQIDVYANGSYVSPTNRDMTSPFYNLRDERNNVTLSSPTGTNYFDRPYQLAYFLIDGVTTIDVKVSPLFILSFGLPPMDANSIYTEDVATKLAALFGMDRTMIRRVKIITASDSSRRRREITSPILYIEMSDEPQDILIMDGGFRADVWSNTASSIIDPYHTGELQERWKNLNVTNDLIPSNFTVKEPFEYTQVNLSRIGRIELRISPEKCREQSPCTVQPVLVAYDSNGGIIEKLGSKDRPWQVMATIVNRSDLVVQGAITNYLNGSTQYTLFGLPNVDSYVIQFTLIPPDGVTSSVLQTANLTVQTSSILVTQAILAGQQVNNIDRVNVSEVFSISIMPIDKITRRQLANIQWGNWTWNSSNVTIYRMSKFNSPGVLVRSSSSTTIVNVQTKTVTITGLSITDIGMYVLNIDLMSSNKEHTISLTSNAILVKNSSNSAGTDVYDGISGRITFLGDYDALNATNELELMRAMIYNYLVIIGMPLVDGIKLVKGSVIALLLIESIATDISRAVSTILSNPNAVPGLIISSVNINDRSYSQSMSQKPNANSDLTTPGKNVGLIVGIIVGLFVGLMLIIGIGYFYLKRRYKASHRSNKLSYLPDSDKPIQNKIDPPIAIRRSLTQEERRKLQGLPTNPPEPQYSSDDAKSFTNINDL